MEAPVFYEVSAERFGDRENLTLLFEGRVRVAPLGTFDVADFNWLEHERTDQSFWIRMERSDYLIPLLERWSEEDQEFLEQWVSRWLDVHEDTWTPNSGAGDDMGIGKRGMILAWYLRRLRQSETENVLLLERLTRTIKEHQVHLTDDSNFTTESNHGVWEAMGLFETTRVLEDPEVTQVSLERLHRIAKLSISDVGFHREHSPSYHFYVLGWLDAIVPYLQSLELDWQELDALAELHGRMRAMTYYLCDHGLNLPQIGDTDATRLDAEPGGQNMSDMAPAVFDKEAGYAIFKDPAGAAAKRYIVFNCQNKQAKPTMKYHFHNDVLAVYYADDGEVILGDTGRYSYTSTPIRRYVVSAAAHNRIISKSNKGTNLNFADDAREVQLDAGVFFEASLWGGTITRSVEIPYERGGFTVSDSVVARDFYTALWHIGHDVDRTEALPPRMEGDAEVHSWRLTTKSGREFDLKISISSDATSADPAVDMVTGLKEPYRGWYSSGYREWKPATLLSITLPPCEWVLMTMEVIPR